MELRVLQNFLAITREQNILRAAESLKNNRFHQQISASYYASPADPGCAVNLLDAVVLSDLIGYEHQKKLLIDNTLAFVEGRKANNVLLFGYSGTGKSTSVKAIVNYFYPQGLRMIEI